MECFRRFKGASRDSKSTPVCVKTDEFVTVADMRQEFLRMRSTNSHLKGCVRVLHENSAKMKQEAHHQQMIISSLKSLYDNTVTKKEEEAREMEMKATACSVVQKVMTQALTKLVAEKDDEAAVKDSMLSQTKEELALSNNETAKLRGEVRDLEAELDAEQKRHQETLKNLRKNELRLKEMTFQSDEDRKKQDRLQELVEKMQQKINTYKTQSDEAASIADDLRQEQDKNAHLERVKKNLEQNIRDFQRRLDEVETGALKAGKRHLQKLETKVRDLEAELDAKQRRHQETLKNLRKNELRLKEMTFQSNEDRKKQERLQELVEKLQLKVKTYKTQSQESVRDLEAELNAEQRRHQETLKNLRKNELRLKEMTFQSDEDHKKQERLQELVEKLQLKIKSHKTQSEASIDLTKAVYEMTTMSQDKQIKELQSALNCTRMEREIFKVLATARRKKEEEEEKHMSNGHMEEMAMRHHQEQARYLGQAWQEATSGTCNMHDTDDRNHQQHPG